MNMEEKEFLRNESVYVRRIAAGNPNTSGAVLAELAKDSDNDVRRSAAVTRIHPVPCWPNWQRIQIGA